MTISDELIEAATHLRARPIEPPPPIRSLRRRATQRRTRRTIAVALVFAVAVVVFRQQDDKGSVSVTDRVRVPTAWVSYGASLLEVNANTVIRHEPEPTTFTPIYEIFAIDNTRFAARVADTATVRAADGTFVRTIADGRLIAGPNNSLWLANGLDSTISHIDTTTFATEERLTISYPKTSIAAITNDGVLVGESRNSALTRIAWDGQKSTVLDQPYRYAVVNRAGTRIAYALEREPNRLLIASLPTDNTPLTPSVTVDVPGVFNVVWSPDDTTIGIIEFTPPGVAGEQSATQRFMPAFISSQPSNSTATLRAVSDAALDEPGQLVFVTPTVAYFIGGDRAARIDLRGTTPRLTRVQSIAAPRTSTSTSCTQGATPDQQRAIDFNGDGKLVIGVATPGPRNDGAYYQKLVECVNRFAKANNGTSIIVDNIPAADAATEIEDLAKQNVDIMMIGAAEIGRSVPELASKYDKTFWYCNCGAGQQAKPYFVQSQDDNAEISYTAGYATGLLLKTTSKSSAAFIGNNSLDFEVIAFESFKLGLQAVDRSFEATYYATGSFSDPAKATEAYNTAKSQGIGAVYPYLGGAHETVAKLAIKDNIITMSAGHSNACQRSDLNYQIAVRFDSGDYLDTLFSKLLAGQLAEGSVYTFHVGVDKEPGAQICKPTTDQQQAMDALYADIASGKVKTR